VPKAGGSRQKRETEQVWFAVVLLGAQPRCLPCTQTQFVRPFPRVFTRFHVYVRTHCGTHLSATSNLLGADPYSRVYGNLPKIAVVLNKYYYEIMPFQFYDSTCHTNRNKRAMLDVTSRINGEWDRIANILSLFLRGRPKAFSKSKLLQYANNLKIISISVPGFYIILL